MNNKKNIFWYLRPEVGTFTLLIIAIFAGILLSPYFADIKFIFNSSSIYLEYGLIALALTFTIITGQIDLSMASVLVLVSCVIAKFYHLGVSMELAMVVGILVGICCGLFNSFLVIKLSLPSLIATIGTMALYRGIAQIMLGDGSLGSFPQWFVNIDMKYIFSNIVPVPLFIFIIVGIIMAILLSKTVFGRNVYLIGSNEKAAIFSGLPVNNIKTIVFTITSLFAAFGGLLMMSRLTVARFDMATGGELDMITIVLLGGTDINGGKGNILGTMISFLLVVVIRTGMSVANIKAEMQLTVMGFLLIAAILLTNLINIARNSRTI